MSSNSPKESEDRHGGGGGAIVAAVPVEALLLRVTKEEAVQRSNIVVEQRSVAMQHKKRWNLGMAYEDDEVRAERNQRHWEHEDTLLRNKRRKQQAEEEEIEKYLDQSALNRQIAEKQNVVVRERNKIRAQMKVVEQSEVTARALVQEEEQRHHVAGFLARYRTLHASVFEKEETYFRDQIKEKEELESFQGWEVPRRLIFDVLLGIEDLAGSIPEGGIHLDSSMQLSMTMSQRPQDHYCQESATSPQEEENGKEAAARKNNNKEAGKASPMPPSSFVSEAGQLLLVADMAFRLMETDNAHAAAMETAEYVVACALAQKEQEEEEAEFSATMDQAKEVERLRNQVASMTVDMNDKFDKFRI